MPGSSKGSTSIHTGVKRKSRGHMVQLNILSIGAGAIGTYIGGSLALQGHRLTFLERPGAATDLADRGLLLTLGDGEHRISKPVVFDSLTQALNAHPYDLALFALKSFDTAGFLQSIQPSADIFPPILCLSNGVDNEPALESALGSEKIIAGTITSAVGRHALGEIVLEKMRGVGIAAGHPLSERLVAEFNRANLNAQLCSKAVDMKWSKMLTNLIANASSAILDMPPSEIFAHPGLYRLEIQQLREALAVMRYLGIKTTDLPGTPVRLLASAVQYLPVSLSRPLMAKAVGAGRGAKMPSFHIDLHHGRGISEVDYLNGAVVRAGESGGIPTPTNDLLNTTLLDLTAGRLPLDAYQHDPGKLIEAFKHKT